MPRFNQELLRSRAFLTLLSSVSTVDLTDPATFLERFEQIFNTFYAAVAAQFLGDFFVVGKANGPASDPAFNALFPLVVVYNTINDQLQEVFRLPSPEGAFADAFAISKNPCRPFIAVNVGREDNTTQVLLYRLNEDGTLTQVNSLLINALPGAIVEFGTVEGATAFSTDGKYLLVLYTTGLDEEGKVTSTNAAIFRVGLEGELRLITTFPLPTAQGLGLQIGNVPVFRPIPGHKDRYAIIAGLATVSVSPFAPNATALLASFIFDPRRGFIRQTGQQTLNQTPIGLDANPELDRVLVATRQSDINDVTVLQIPSPASSLAVPRPDAELRLYAFDARAKLNALEFLKANAIDSRSAGLRWGNRGERIALAQEPLAFVPAVARTGLATPVEADTFSGGYLTTFAYNREDDTLHYEDVKPLSPFALALAWDDCDRRLGVAGVPIPPVFFGGDEPSPGSGLRDVQLYAVSANEKKH